MTRDVSRRDFLGELATCQQSHPLVPLYRLLGERYVVYWNISRA